MNEKMSKNIFQKMAEITNELGTVSKNLNVEVSKTASYKAVSEVDILNAVKPLEYKHGVYSYPHETNIINQEIVTTKTQYGDRDYYFIRLERIYRFVNVEDPKDYIEVKSYGDGIDTGDKATGKAMTYADKYALMKAYKISTGDDPDKEASDESPKHQSKPQPISKATDKQLQLIKELYSVEELTTMLERMNKDLYSLTVQEASKMIKARSKK